LVDRPKAFVQCAYPDLLEPRFRPVPAG
jgi:hypothetical protein